MGEALTAADGIPILVVGSVALDSIETAAAAHDDLLGGAAAHFSIAASLLAPVRLVAVVGTDFPADRLDLLRGRNIDLAGLEVADGASFRWRGRYHLDMDHRDTLSLDLGVFATFRPRLPDGWADTPIVFLANIDPDLQLHVLGQATGARVTACDTIEHWISEKRDSIDQVFSRVDIVFLNEDEARLYADTENLSDAAAVILARGCKAVFLKRGSHGSLVVQRQVDGTISEYHCPAVEVAAVADPTGAGDAYAGGVMGWISSLRDPGPVNLGAAAAMGAAMASFAIEGFGPSGLQRATLAGLRERLERAADAPRV